MPTCSAFRKCRTTLSNLDGGTDQSAQLAALLPDHLPVFRPAIETIDSEGRVHRFGNMTLSRLPVLQIANHLLPWPGAGAVRSMRRQALEVTVQTAFGPLRIVNTHLEYHSAGQREAQIDAAAGFAAGSIDQPEGIAVPGTTSLTEARRWRRRACCAAISISTSSDPQHALIHQSARPGLNYRDAWNICNPGQPRSPTCGLYDHAQWTDGPDCRDFIFTSEDLTGRIRRVEVDGKTDASDHQPVLIELAD